MAIHNFSFKHFQYGRYVTNTRNVYKKTGSQGVLVCIKLSVLQLIHCPYIAPFQNNSYGSVSGVPFKINVCTPLYDCGWIRFFSSGYHIQTLSGKNRCNRNVVRLCSFLSDHKTVCSAHLKSFYSGLELSCVCQNVVVTVKMVSGGLRQLGHEANHSASSNAEVKNEWNHISTPAV